MQEFATYPARRLGNRKQGRAGILRKFTLSECLRIECETAGDELFWRGKCFCIDDGVVGLWVVAFPNCERQQGTNPESHWGVTNVTQGAELRTAARQSNRYQ